MSVQIKKNGVWEAVAGNATNTSGITESSALSNIGTSANATQHDVNVAIDSALEGNVRYHTSNGTDLDSLIRPGIYSVQVINAANQHAPTNGWMSLFISCWDNSVGYVQQLAIDVDGNIWFRMSDNTTWNSWRQLAFQS